MRIAYLVNCYPAPSHSFIRREIAGVEAAGLHVLPYSIRPAPTPLPDPRDEQARRQTVTVLDKGLVFLLSALIIEALTRPAGLIRALACAWRMGRVSSNGAWRQMAYLAEAAWLKRQWRAKGITHVHAHFGTNPTAVARLAYLWGGPPYSFTVHGPDEFDAPGAIDLGGKIADAAFVVGISNYGRSQLMRWAAPADWTKIEIVRCGVDREFLDAAPSGLPDNATLCCVARLGPQKGLHILVDAIAMIVPERPDLRVIVLGEGPLRASLEARTVALGIAANIEFAGVASSDAVRQHMTDSRAFVLPSFAEGLPVVLMEALALRRPVITTWVAGIPELVDAQVAWLSPPGDVAALAASIRAALNAPMEQLAAMGALGHARVAAMHDAMKNGAEMATLLKASRTR